jgi:hypothetical protein
VRDHQDHQVMMEHQAHLDLMVPQEQQVQRETQEHLERQV